jgi:hypothetical protein
MTDGMIKVVITRRNSDGVHSVREVEITPEQVAKIEEWFNKHNDRKRALHDRFAEKIEKMIQDGLYLPIKIIDP